MTRIPFVDLRAQHRELEGTIERAFAGVTAEAAFILGPSVERFEARARELMGAAAAIAVSSGTDALVLSLLAIGVRPGDTVITTPFSFIATAESILRVGAIPRFVDLDDSTLSLATDQLEVSLAAGARAVLPAHIYGRCDGIPEIAELAARYGVDLVEDAAQAFGSRCSGRAAGTWGRAGTFSFFPTKVLGAMGDAGLVVTSDPGVGERCRSLRQHGRGPSGEYVRLGGNFRMDSLQAAVLSVKLQFLEQWITTRRRHAAAYDAAFAGLPGVRLLGGGPEWNGAVYSLRIGGGRRDALRAFLSERGMETAVYYGRPLHQEPVMAEHRLRPGSLPVAEALSGEVLSLPVSPELTSDQRAAVIDAVQSFFERG